MRTDVNGTSDVITARRRSGRASPALLVCSAGLALGTLALAGGLARRAPSELSPAHARDEAARLGVSRVAPASVLVLAGDARARTPVDILITASDAEHVLHLVPHAVRAPGYRLLADVGDGRLVDRPAPPESTYRGTLEGRPGSVVAASLTDAGLSAVVLDGDRVWAVQPVPGRAGQHTLHDAADALPADVSCGVPDAAHAHHAAHADHDHAPALLGTPACARTALCAFDADFEYYTALGSTTGAVATDIDQVMNVVNAIYNRDAAIEHAIGSIVVRTTSADPYTSNNSSTRLSQFRTEWLNNQGAVARDMAHLMTGVDLTGSVIGVAYLSGVCTSNAYGLSQTLWTGSLPFRAALTAHEMGHNWGANHCDGESDCAIMCSGLGGCTGIVTQFGESELTNIRSFRDTRTCLDAGALAGPIPPRARRDAANLINVPDFLFDVLANDVDANCQPLTILSFANPSVFGGSVQSETGLDGVQRLRYTPAPGFTGFDSFTYTVIDSDGLTSTAEVAPRVIPTEQPVASPGTLTPGLHAAYYALNQSFSALPDFSTREPYLSETVAQINYPSTDGPFANSGLADVVGVVYTGYFFAANTGVYQFFTESDDGSKLWINDTLVVNNDGLHGMVEVGAPISLTPGYYALRVEFFENFGGAGLIARASGPFLSKQVIPASLLFSGSCRADANADTTLDAFDFNAFVDAFNENNAAVADVNGDTSLDAFDFNAFVDAFNAGCP